ncbi:glycosyltransferase family 2 protein [Mesorhizobium sp. CU2]|uniref:glycosyltransferase family 2 protein n=1 Tax=unclassified Mesorhizobium TaxID=325217 RepID=UPI00112956FD|nr:MULTISPECIES: glycosyltransferase family 2 protein [unclassified Mesorhizobium]TPN85047.1 glycosyltransferase family 2 protein [Mesorhizobium sp. CU3]TPO13006.1 glycosyltransferase family 2 protein [Mesorhizobium sp. CU2]
MPIADNEDRTSGQAPEPRFSVVSVTYNSAQVLPGLLDSLKEGLAGVAFEIVIADNDSADASVEIALNHPSKPRVVQMGRNAGYSAGINAASAVIRKDANLLIMNPDVRLMPGAARVLLERLSDRSVGVAVPKVFEADGRLAWSLRREPSLVTGWTDAVLGGKLSARLGTGEKVGNPARYENGAIIDWAEGSVLAVAARARALVGDWDESFFLYSEETDYMRRVRSAGLSVAYVPGAHAIHIGGDYNSPRLAALLAHNRIKYYRRHHGAVSTALFRMSIALGEGLRAARGPAHRAAALIALFPPSYEGIDLIVG